MVALHAMAPRHLTAQVDKGFSELNIPSSFELVSTVEKTRKEDFVLGASSGKVRIYKVPTTMAQASQALISSFGIKSLDAEYMKQGLKDDRLLASRISNCRPFSMPLKALADSFIVFITDTNLIQQDDGGKVYDVRTYERNLCDTTIQPSFVAIFVWADGTIDMKRD